MPHEIKSRVEAGEHITVEIIYPSGHAGNVLRWGTGALNVDASRVPADWANDPSKRGLQSGFTKRGHQGNGTFSNDVERSEYDTTKGRWPANVCHDGSPEVLAAFARFGTNGSASGEQKTSAGAGMSFFNDGVPKHNVGVRDFGDTGTAARFFYTAKADAAERCDSKHPTVKPVALMEWLVTLVTPRGGRVLDCFCGTGSTLVACDRLGFDAVGIEQDAQTVADAEEKIRRFRARRAIGEVTARYEPIVGQLGLDL